MAGDTGPVPIAVVMISLNEGHNMQAVCDNLRGWAQEVFLVDSYSKDDTVDVALRNGVHVVQRRFRAFGDQWNFALANLPIRARWTMKIDPDERMSEELKRSIRGLIAADACDAIRMRRRLWFMHRPLPVTSLILRAWKTGTCRFTDVAVNEHPQVTGRTADASGDLEHHDSPSLEHWIDKQNRYTTAEAHTAYEGRALAAEPRLCGTALQRRMWFKRHLFRTPLGGLLFFLFNWLWLGAWRAGWVGYAWSRLRCDVMRIIEYKRREMELLGGVPSQRQYGPGAPDPRVAQW